MGMGVHKNAKACAHAGAQRPHVHMSPQPHTHTLSHTPGRGAPPRVHHPQLGFLLRCFDLVIVAYGKHIFTNHTHYTLHTHTHTRTHTQSRTEREKDPRPISDLITRHLNRLLSPRLGLLLGCFELVIVALDAVRGLGNVVQRVQQVRVHVGVCV